MINGRRLTGQEVLVIMPVRPVSTDGLVSELADTVVDLRPGRWLLVAIDGAPATDTAHLADALVDPIRAGGRPTLRVRAEDFLRPASLRFEHGRTDPDAFYDDWLDVGALRREVLDPLGDNGSGRVLPSLWDAASDRASRAGYVSLPAGGVVLLDGALLLGRGLPFDLTVHLSLSAGALARTVAADLRWTLPAFHRYTTEIAPERLADVVVRVDDARRPAIVHNRRGDRTP
jgi:hypothetical protein